MEKIIVGIADLKVSKEEGKIVTLGLGSCIGIVLHDRVNKITGMAHIMLPNSNQIRQNSNPAKFADTGIIKLLSEMMAIGAERKNIIAKIAGGANMFSTSSNSNLKIGEKNYESTLKVLKALKIPVINEDCGKNYGRTLEVEVLTGKVTVKTISHGNKTM